MVMYIVLLDERRLKVKDTLYDEFVSQLMKPMDKPELLRVTAFKTFESISSAVPTE